MAQPKTNFFLIGTPKSGTTSLYHYLEQHPEVFVPKIKEPHFFSTPEVTHTYYKTDFVTTHEHYESIYNSASSETILADFSSSYLFHSKAAKRIFEYNPQAKIGVVLRNPTERALSHYLMDVSQGYITASLDEVLQNKSDFDSYYQQYVMLGEYEKQLKPYLEVFPKEQIKVLFSDHFFESPIDFLSEIFAFLGVDIEFRPTTETSFNQYKEPRFKWIGKLKQSSVVQKVLLRLPTGIKKPLSKLFFDATKEKPNFAVAEAWLKDHYKESIEKTEALIETSLDSWKK